MTVTKQNLQPVSRPRCREASEPLFEKRSDAVKMSETPYPTNGSGKNPAKDTGIKYSNLCTHPCPYRLAGLGTFPEIGDS